MFCKDLRVLGYLRVCGLCGVCGLCVLLVVWCFLDVWWFVMFGLVRYSFAVLCDLCACLVLVAF